jgi:hypothetical protein
MEWGIKYRKNIWGSGGSFMLERNDRSQLFSLQKKMNHIFSSSYSY